jgi:hypothetical protein
MNDITFASEIGRQIPASMEEVTEAFHASCTAILRSEPWEEDDLHIISEMGRNRLDGTLGYVASGDGHDHYALGNECFTNITPHDKRAAPGSLRRRIANLFSCAEEHGLDHLHASFITDRDAISAHDLILYSIEAGKWDQSRGLDQGDRR